MERWVFAGAVIVILGGLALSACASTSSAPSAHVVPPAVTSASLRPTVEQAQVELYLQGVQAQETLEAVRALQTATAVAGQATATAMAWQATATAQAVGATATAQAWEATATAQAVQATATAHAQAVRATATAQAGWATATADAILWQQAATATRSAWEVQATSTAVAAAAIATAQAAQAEQARLEAERARLVYPVRAYGPWAILAVAVIMLAWGGYLAFPALAARLRAVPRDRRGDAPVFLLPKPGGGVVVVDPDRSFGPATVIDGEVTQPALAPPEYQERTTARDQAVDLVTRGLPGEKRRRRRTPVGLLGPGSRRPPVVRVVPPEEVRQWLEEVEPKVLEAGNE